MGLFGFGKKKDGLIARVAKGAVREVSAEYSQNKDFLEAVCAAVALVAVADGDIEESEKRSAVSIVTAHPTLGKLYQQGDIEECLSAMFSRAKTHTGRASLGRELADVKGKPNSPQMCEDVYLVATDIAGADGDVDEKEAAVLEKIANFLGVDPAKSIF